jgi:hypothetical protein
VKISKCLVFIGTLNYNKFCFGLYPLFAFIVRMFLDVTLNPFVYTDNVTFIYAPLHCPVATRPQITTLYSCTPLYVSAILTLYLCPRKYLIPVVFTSVRIFSADRAFVTFSWPQQQLFPSRSDGVCRIIKTYWHNFSLRNALFLQSLTVRILQCVTVIARTL